MIKTTRGNLLEAEADALVNTVNTVGVMGKGIALQFKRAYPKVFQAYKTACDRGELQIGQMHVVDLGRLGQPRWVINFPTKRHWRAKSRMEDIEVGLADLVGVIRRLDLKSIALPPLGCGNGGLEWGDVRPLIEAALAPLGEVEVSLFEPAGAPPAGRMRVGTARPKMTPGRAAFIGLLARYKVPGYDYRLSMLEAQKLAYLLQVAGEPLKLQYAAHHYGPYADNLRHVLARLEGHFLLGYGDGGNQPDTPLTLLSDAVEEAERHLSTMPDARARFDRVTKLIYGFETPFGMELLSSVLWCAVQEGDQLETVTECVRSWSPRKRKQFQPQHIEVALQRLREQDWLPT